MSKIKAQAVPLSLFSFILKFTNVLVCKLAEVIGQEFSLQCDARN